MDQGISALGTHFSEISTMKRKGVFSGWSERDKADVVYAIEDGWSDDQILDLLPHISRGSVTAFRAHVTRGTYEQGVINGSGNERRPHRPGKTGI